MAMCAFGSVVQQLIYSSSSSWCYFIKTTVFELNRVVTSKRIKGGEKNNGIVRELHDARGLTQTPSLVFARYAEQNWFCLHCGGHKGPQIAIKN